MRFSTKRNEKYWANRKIDWKKEYLDTANHPHRDLIIHALRAFQWKSLWEVGCASGPNLLKIMANFPNAQLGGTDINPDAIALAEKTFRGGIFDLGNIEDIMLSDKATDVILSDMTLIYIGPFKIRKVIKEMMRVCRGRIIMVEFDSPKFWKRLKLRLDGYNSYDYKKLLESCGCYDIQKFKIPPEFYPDLDYAQKEFATLISAKCYV